jgi:hypothetical protein
VEELLELNDENVVVYLRDTTAEVKMTVYG